ncbi:oxygen-independent coproporphyrinogen-3 oxidase [Natronospira proteinivora]|uniref:Heme chaperone HemW n=1 Tax=Natronospira proteinivora TaxID=1807133 RepID=A0ABT1G9J7_9GAMM|nr:radical SAM family heme chaperone HemW [Natronospira proteinivora]MCP1727980.1 oxygen-independent coproporphyrinogen-3 oxidase [Natronospira proteinivora]
MPHQIPQSSTPFGHVPLGLYIHLPWCEKKCPYCDFNSHALTGPIPEADYVTALKADMDREAAYAQGRVIETVFIGGGTPSLFSARAIGEVLEHAEQTVGLAPDVEITLESNPGSAEAERFRDYRAAGVNRLSIGVQSFDDRALKAIGRIHDSDQAREAARMAREAGFERLNLDLMFGLPDQSEDQALADVETALALDPDHISHYELTLEPNTAFHSRPPELPDEDQRWAMQERCGEGLERAGLGRYEISAWARPGQACRHNLNYWRFGDYLAIGAGAHGKHSLNDGQVWRNRKHRIPQRFMALTTQGEAEVSRHALTPENRVFEYMLNALRLVEGFSEGHFERLTALDAERIRPALRQLQREGLMQQAGEQWRPSARGLNFLNELQARFLPEAA